MIAPKTPHLFGPLGLAAAVLTAHAQLAPSAEAPPTADAVGVEAPAPNQSQIARNVVADWDEYRQTTPPQVLQREGFAKLQSLIATVEIGALEPADVALMSQMLLTERRHLDKAAAAVAPYVDEESVRGALSRTLNTWLTNEAQKSLPSAADIDRVFAHPNLEESISAGNATPLFELMFAVLGKGHPTAVQAYVEPTVNALLKATPELTASELISAAKAYLISLNVSTLADVRPSREHLLGVFESALEGTPPSDKVAREALEIAIDRVGFVGNPAPEIDFQWSSTPLAWENVSGIEGRVVVLDFWATWCGPCIAAFPEMRRIVDRYQEYPVTLLGVTHLQGRHQQNGQVINTRDNPEKERELMLGFIEEMDMTWPVVFADGEQYGYTYMTFSIPHVSIVAPDGTLRVNGLRPRLTPTEEVFEIIDGLLEEAGLPFPGEPAPDQ